MENNKFWNHYNVLCNEYVSIITPLLSIITSLSQKTIITHCYTFQTDKLADETTWACQCTLTEHLLPRRPVWPENDETETVSHSPGPASSDFDSEFVALTQSIARRQLPVSRHQRHGSVAVRVRPGSLRPGGSDSDRDPAGRARAPAPSRPMPACGGSHCTKLQFEYSAVGRRILHEESALKSSSESLHLGNKSSDLLRRW